MQETLADKLAALSGMDKVFFCNSGLEANEAALKIARKYGHDRGVANPEIVVYETRVPRPLASRRCRRPATRRCRRASSRWCRASSACRSTTSPALERVAAEHPNVVAVFLEAIQGEGGITPARVDYLKAVRALCDERGWLLMIDEVQCGIGRTGKWFAHQWAGIVPDVMPLAKGLAGGVPIGAVVAARRGGRRLRPGQPRHDVRRQSARVPRRRSRRSR